MDRNNPMQMNPLSANDVCQRDQPYNSSEPLSSEATVISNGLVKANNHRASSPDSPDTETFHSSFSSASASQTTVECFETMVGDESIQQETATLQINGRELAAANEAEVEKLREIERLQLSQNGLHQQIETLKKDLAEAPAVKASDQGVRTSPMINTNTKRHFMSNSKIYGHHPHHPRKINKRWKHSIRVIALSFFALSWFHLHLLATSNLPTLATELEEYPSLRGATGLPLLSKKMIDLKDQLRKMEGEQAKKLASHDGQTVLCCVARDEEPYIGEWVDYHLGLGFGKIVVYDNSKENELKHWGRGKGNSLEVVHYPGSNIQQITYWDCAKKTRDGKFGKKIWIGFWDIDEFLVLKKHDNVDDFVGEYLTTGALGINWHMFGPSGMSLYQPLPVTKRFVCRQNKANAHVKSIGRLKDLNFEIAPHVHFPYLIHGTLHDTNGRSFEGPFNEDGPTDIAALHHFRTKSVKEFLQKTVRGRADADDNSNHLKPLYLGRVENAHDIFEKVLSSDGDQVVVAEPCHNLTRDDSAWSAIKKIAPKYALYDALPNEEQSPLPFNLENILLDLEF